MMARLHTSLPSTFALALLAACGGPAPSGVAQPASSSKTSERSLVCQGSPAPAALEHGLCVCGDLRTVGGLAVEPGRPGEPASVGVNGVFDGVSDATIDGALVAFAGIELTSSLAVSADLATAGDAHFVGKVDVGGDLDVGGSLTGVGTLAVGGEARVAGAHEVLGSDLAFAPFTTPVASPCGCDPATFVDVPGIVLAAATQNENAAHGLGTHLGDVGDTDLALTTGSYYFDDAEAVGKMTLHIEGTVALHLGGDLAFVGDATIELAPGATLDLYVAGNVATVGALTTTADDPSAVRLFIGGSSPVTLASVGDHHFTGAIHAPTANLAWVGDTIIEGAILANGIDGVGALTIRQWSPTESLPAECNEPASGEEPASGSGSASDHGADCATSPASCL